MIGFIQFFGAIVILTIVSWGLYSSRHAWVPASKNIDDNRGLELSGGKADELHSVVQQLRDRIKALEDELKNAKLQKSQVHPSQTFTHTSDAKAGPSDVAKTLPTNQSSSTAKVSRPEQTATSTQLRNSTHSSGHQKASQKSKIKQMQDAATIMGLETSILPLGVAKRTGKGHKNHKDAKNETSADVSKKTGSIPKSAGVGKGTNTPLPVREAPAVKVADASKVTGGTTTAAASSSEKSVTKSPVAKEKTAIPPPPPPPPPPVSVLPSPSSAAGKKSLADEVLAVLGKPEEILPVSATASAAAQPAAATKTVAIAATAATTAVSATTTSGTSMSSYSSPFSGNSNRSAYSGPYYYMYELDEEFWWRWPKPGTDCSKNGYVGHEHAELSGMGPPLIPENGLFLTWHFSLFSSLFNRLKRSRRRTYDPEKASLFVVPYDLGLDGYLHAPTCRNSRKCTRGLPEKLQDILSKSKYFKRHDGADHVVLWSLGQYHPWPSNGCDLFMRNFCGKCTFTCYWMDPTKAATRFISVPFPSGYHWWDGIKNLPWALSPPGYRNLTAVYLGSTQTLNPAHTKIRRAMTAQCNVSKECHWMQIAHSSKDASIADFLSIYKRSIFCLCPPGDDPARKAVFDSILSGCIPVIFEVATLYNQYPWHLGEQTALDISVSIPGGLVRSGKLDFMSVLLAIPPDVIRKKQEALARVAPRIQYAMPPPELLKNRSDATPWDPPFSDGVDVIVDGLFERVSLVLANKSTGIPHRLMTSAEWSREYDVIKVKVPGEPLGGAGAAVTTGGGHGVGAGLGPRGRGERGGGRGHGHHRKRMGPGAGAAAGVGAA